MHAFMYRRWHMFISLRAVAPAGSAPAQIYALACHLENETGKEGIPEALDYLSEPEVNVASIQIGFGNLTIERP